MNGNALVGICRWEYRHPPVHEPQMVRFSSVRGCSNRKEELKSLLQLIFTGNQNKSCGWVPSAALCAKLDVTTPTIQHHEPLFRPSDRPPQTITEDNFAWTRRGFAVPIVAYHFAAIIHRGTVFDVQQQEFHRKTCGLRLTVSTVMQIRCGKCILSHSSHKHCMESSSEQIQAFASVR